MSDLFNGRPNPRPVGRVVALTGLDGACYKCGIVIPEGHHARTAEDALGAPQIECVIECYGEMIVRPEPLRSAGLIDTSTTARKPQKHRPASKRLPRR